MEEEILDFQADGVEGLGKAVRIGRDCKTLAFFFPFPPPRDPYIAVKV